MTRQYAKACFKQDLRVSHFCDISAAALKLSVASGAGFPGGLLSDRQSRSHQCGGNNRSRIGAASGASESPATRRDCQRISSWPGEQEYTEVAGADFEAVCDGDISPLDIITLYY